MRQRLFLSLAAVLIVSGALLYVYVGLMPGKKPAGVKPAADAPFGLSGLPAPTRQEPVGEKAASLAEAEARIGRKVKLADPALTGGAPVIYTGAEQVLSLDYPNGVAVSSGPGPSSWPAGMDARQWYAQFVKTQNETLESTETANVENRPENLNSKYQLLDIAGNPGYGRDKDYQLIDRKRHHPLPAYVKWTQDGFDYYVDGATETPLSAVIKIAESVAKSN